MLGLSEALILVGFLAGFVMGFVVGRMFARKTVVGNFQYVCGIDEDVEEEE